MDDGTAGEMVVSATYWKGMSTNTSSDSSSGMWSQAGGGDNESGGNETFSGGSRDDRFSTRPKTSDTEGSGALMLSVLGETQWGYRGLESGNFKVEVMADNAEVILKPCYSIGPRIRNNEVRT